MNTMKAIRIHRRGGPEVLVYEDAPVPALQPGDALVRVHAAGISPAGACPTIRTSTLGSFCP